MKSIRKKCVFSLFHIFKIIFLIIVVNCQKYIDYDLFIGNYHYFGWVLKVAKAYATFHPFKLSSLDFKVVNLSFEMTINYLIAPYNYYYSNLTS